ncbi:MAG TPA: NUDIX domain-containing protein [Candidatus Competibacteraceae bacterium]|nr:NUDIX domain-containing protein [Candidatus Competibacteraceae bacterium]
MNRDHVLLLERDCVYQGRFRVERYRLSYRLYDGRYSAELSREVFERGHVGAVLPVDPVRDAVVLIEQFRVGAYVAGWQPWLVECVAGIIEAGETSEELVRREAREEAGCVITDLVPIMRFLTSPGACSETVALYCGRVDSAKVGGLHGLAAEGEDIRVLALPIVQALEMLEQGLIVNAKTIIALQWLERHYAGLKRHWLGEAD